jgi:hypothetical protein
MVMEAQVAQLIATALLDPATVLPLEVNTLHKRVRGASKTQASKSANHVEWYS